MEKFNPISFGWFWMLLFERFVKIRIQIELLDDWFVLFLNDIFIIKTVIDKLLKLIR